MKRISFNDGWRGGPARTAFSELAEQEESALITLPHDAVRDLPRGADFPDGADNGYFPGGYFRYSKSFEVPEDYRERTVLLEFEGVYRDAVVFVNGQFAGQRPFGYSRFTIDLVPYLLFGQTNTIEVESRAHRDTRWYTGAGIYRGTALVVGELVHLALEGTRVATPEIESDLAVVAVETEVVNAGRHTTTLRLSAEVRGPDGGTIATGTAPVTVLPGSAATARFRLLVPEPALWDVDSPALHTLHLVLRDGDRDVDAEETAFGIRSLSVDPVRGLRINGRGVVLRGACIHHDNGLLGSATIARAEERRVEILKAAGFNAIRSSHNPLSVAMLEACDRLGMLVLDEAFDVWTQPKTPFDYSLSFPEWWERDIESMVAKDFNHPSVIMYSIGNEIFETGSAVGSTWGRAIAEKVRELDPTRFVTNAVNGLVSVSDDIPDVLSEAADGPSDVNSLIAAMSERINELGASEQVSARTEESHAVLDVSGINYCDGRYATDRLAYPNRVILGTETFPGRIDELWRLVTEHSHVIGDFTWTGWDYLGESGVGRTEYPDEQFERGSFHAPFPALTAGCADIDITGHRRPMSYYRETVFGLRTEPYIAVHRPEYHGRAMVRTPWSWSDALSSWSWDAEPGAPVTVDVYSAADHVELLLDGTFVGRAAVGAEQAFIARFETRYAPGELVAVAYRDGVEAGRTALRTVRGPVVLSARADRSTIRADDTDLAYVTIELGDAQGTVATNCEVALAVEVSGAGTLVGLGTGRSVTEEPFGASVCTSYDGRATAIIRPNAVGVITVRVTAPGYAAAELVVNAG